MNDDHSIMLVNILIFKFKNIQEHFGDPYEPW